MDFLIPSLSTILTFVIQIFIVLAGIAALLNSLFGAFLVIVSGGEKEKMDKAKSRIINSFVGLLVMIVILAVLVTLEQYVFQQRICFGLSCPLSIPSLLE